MRRRRSGGDGDDSLELLLDTITNAFGGIVFLAILVIILLQNSSETSTPASKPDEDPLALATELAEPVSLWPHGVRAERRTEPRT